MAPRSTASASARRWVIEDHGLPSSLAAEQAIGTAGVEPNHPLSHDLKHHAADPWRFAPAACLVDLCHRQQRPLCGALLDDQARRRSTGPSKSPGSQIAVPVPSHASPASSSCRTPSLQTFTASGIPRVSQAQAQLGTRFPGSMSRRASAWPCLPHGGFFPPGVGELDAARQRGQATSRSRPT